MSGAETAQQCLCGSGKPGQRCCGRFLSGESYPKTPEQLMRSRYCAYALGGHGEYLLATWFPATAGTLTVPVLSERQHDWQKLEVVDKCQRGDAGEVEFRAWYLDRQGREHCLHERSEFSRVNGRWLYVGAIVEGGAEH
jgi:SEC-C motif-containing protein